MLLLMLYLRRGRRLAPAGKARHLVAGAAIVLARGAARVDGRGCQEEEGGRWGGDVRRVVVVLTCCVATCLAKCNKFKPGTAASMETSDFESLDSVCTSLGLSTS